MARHMESSYIVGLLGVVNPTKGKEDAMELLCHLSKMKKIDMQACRESIMNRLMRYTILGLIPRTAVNPANGRGSCTASSANSVSRPRGFNLNIHDVCGLKSCLWFEGKAMSIFSTNTEAKRWPHLIFGHGPPKCQGRPWHYNAEMVKLISKSERNLGRPYWKCFTTYEATRCSGYEWVIAANTPTESDIQNQVDVKELNAYAKVIRILKGINKILLLLLVLSFLNLAVILMKK
ncbi:unnamed protein product [Prunus brigantina]